MASQLDSQLPHDASSLAQQYALALARYAERPCFSTLYGVNYCQALANYMRPMIKGFPAPISIMKQDSCTHVIVHEIQPDGTERRDFNWVSGLATFTAMPQLRACCAQLVFVRGLPSPEWISILGSKYKLPPEYFHRHLSILEPNNHYDWPPIPSTSMDILTLQFTILCKRGVPVPQQDIAETRKNEFNFIRKHYDLLAKDGCVGDSLLRRYALHNGVDYTLEQAITLCVTTNDHGSWTGMALLDPGRTMASRTVPTHLLQMPHTLDELGEALPSLSNFYHSLSNDSRSCAQTRSAQLSNANTFHEPINTIINKYGHQLDPETMKADALYALSDVFRLCATSENQFLNFMDAQIHDITLKTWQDVTVSVQSLQHCKILLDEHVEYLLAVQNWLKTAEHSKWPRAGKPREKKIARAVIEPLIMDFDHLARKACMVSTRSVEAINIVVNIPMLQASRGAVREARVMKRLTILVFMFLPLTLVTGIFGMNVNELGAESISIWIPFMCWVPVIIGSFLLPRVLSRGIV